MVGRVNGRDLATHEIVLDRAIFRCRGPGGEDALAVVVETVLSSITEMRQNRCDEATRARLDRLEAKARQHK